MRSPALPLIALVLAAYGIWTALYVPAMLVGPIEPLLLIGFVLQAVFAIVAAAGIWTGQPWAAVAVLILGASIAFLQIVEGFLLGILPWLRALLVAVLAIVGAVLLAAYLRRAPTS